MTKILNIPKYMAFIKTIEYGNSYAIDLNHNGIVDKGEIKKY